MDDAYEMYCLTDPVFYDSFVLKGTEEHDYELAQGSVPEGWECVSSGDWLMYVPPDPELPSQGWKIHASASMDSAVDTLAVIWGYCVARGIPFKFIRSKEFFFLRNVKYSPRGASGKFVTIYPADDAQLEIVLSELGAALEGQQGPYILSDLRIGTGPLYVRYGGFVERYCIGAGGEPELALEDAAGELIPDRRGTTFATPPWVTLPRCLVAHLEARNSTTVEGLPYRIDRALHFSNGGGVYAATHLATGEDVVLKEARPHAGLAWDGADAVKRLGNERDMLQRLAGLDVVPKLRDYFTLGEHHFLVEDFVEGSTLMSQIVRRYPVGVLGAVDETAVAGYASWALAMCERVEAAVAQLHARGVAFGDLSPANMLVRDDDSIVLIDLEVATLASDEAHQSLATGAFKPPSSQVGLAVDRYALACLRLFVFLPQLTALFLLDPGKAPQLAASIAEAFPVPGEFLAGAVSVIEAAQEPPEVTARTGRPPRLEPDPAAWQAARDSMVAAIRASATPDRQDRLFPGHPRQFATAGSALGIDYGAAGVLYALHATGAPRDEQHEQWLVAQATNPPSGTPLGLYDGLHGVAYVLDRLERRDDALKVLEICLDALRQQRDHLGLDLSGGLAGIALTLAHFAARNDDAGLWDSVWEIADIVAQRLGDEDSVAQTSGGDKPYAGLLKGSSGPAVMFMRLHQQRPDRGLLDLAATAIRQDLRRCVTRDGVLHVDEVWRTLPYISDGSVGIGFAVDDYLAHRHDDQLAQAAPLIHAAAKSGFYAGSGLFSGRAGMLLYRSRGLAPGTCAEDPVVAAHVRRLNWHAMSYRGHLTFPGDQLLRLSMDLGTGTAGVLLALGSALHDEPVHLPFLGAVHPDTARTDPDLILMTEGR